MSVGYGADPTQPAPFDPEAARLAAMQPPPPIPPVAIPTVPPAAPTGIDSVNPGAVADQIAAVGNPSTPPLPPPTPTAPGAPTPQMPITPAPPGAPAATAAGTPETPKQTDELKAAQDLAQKAREASDKAQVDLQKAGQPAVEEQQKIREQQVRDQQESMRQQQLLQQKYQTAEDAADKQIAASQAAIKGFKFRDYFADGNGGTNWALKIGTALSAAIGAFGAGLTHGPNYALQILNKNMDDAHQHQLDELGKMKDEEVMQRTGLQDIRAARAKANADLTVNDAARDKLVAAQLDQAAARKESAQFAPSLTAAAAKLRQEATEKDAAAKAALVQMNLKLADEGRKKAVDESTIAKNTAEAGLANKKTEVGGFAPHKGAAGHSGGGAGGAAQVGTDAEELARRIRVGIDGKPLTDDQIIHAATELHIPLAGKAGVVTLDKVRSVAKFDADAAIKNRRAGVQDTRIDDKEANDWASSNGLKPIEKSQRELSSLNKQLTDNANNPLNQALAVEKAVSAARGGAASKQALSLALHHLGGSLDNAEGIVQGWRDGTLGAKQKQNFIDFVNGQLGAAQKEGAEKYADYNKYVESQPEAKRAGLLAARGRLFSGLHGFGAGGGGAGPVDEAKVARAQAAQSSPQATAAQKANAAAYLKSVGR